MKNLLWLLLLFCALPSFGQVVGQSGACTASHVVVTGATTSTTLTCTPNAANHALIIVSDCSTDGIAQASVTIAASPSTGWSFYQTSNFTGTSAASNWAQSWGAIIPNTSATTFTFTWSTNCGFSSNYAQEWSGNDITGGATTFYSPLTAVNTGTTGGCSGAAVTSTSANDAVFAFCNDSLPTTSWQGAGWTQGFNDANGDGSEYKITTGSQTPTWASTANAFNNGTILVKAAVTSGGSFSGGKSLSGGKSIKN